MGTDDVQPVDGWVRDRYWFRDERNRTLLAGAPLRYFEVTQAGARVLDALEHGPTLPGGHESLTARLAAAGAIHPVPHLAADPARLTVVIPAYVRSHGDASRLHRLLGRLAPLSTVVVDDHSPHPIDPASCALAGVRIIRHDRNQGPSAARRSGLALVDTPLVAFVDTDVLAHGDDLLRLASLLDSCNVALVAPRIRTAGPSAIDDYESHRSPLDMGAHPALMTPNGRVPYLPSAVMVARVDRVRAVGGFDAAMRIGEDVDLSWRLASAGETCRYVPQIGCAHDSRPDIRSLARQRFTYGLSAADLASRHPQTFTPLRAHVTTAVPAVLALTGLVVSAALLALPAIAWSTFTLRELNLSTARRVRIGTIGLASTVQLMARATRREWWPAVLLLSAVTPHASVALVLSVSVPLLTDLVRFRPRHVVRYCVLRILDDAAYGLGVWSGALRARSFRAFVPKISVRRSIAR